MWWNPSLHHWCWEEILEKSSQCLHLHKAHDQWAAPQFSPVLTNMNQRLKSFKLSLKFTQKQMMSVPPEQSPRRSRKSLPWSQAVSLSSSCRKKKKDIQKRNSICGSSRREKLHSSDKLCLQLLLLFLYPILTQHFFNSFTVIAVIVMRASPKLYIVDQHIFKVHSQYREDI